MIRLPVKVQYDPQLNVILVDPQTLGNVVISIGGRTHIKDLDYFDDRFQFNLLEAVKNCTPDMDVSVIKEKMLRVLYKCKEYNDSAKVEKDINDCLEYLKGL